MSGTTNILDQMDTTGASFADALAELKLGYGRLTRPLTLRATTPIEGCDCCFAGAFHSTFMHY